MRHPLEPHPSIQRFQETPVSSSYDDQIASLLGNQLRLDPLYEEKSIEVPHQVIKEEWIEVPKIEERVVEVIDEEVEYVDKPVYRRKVSDTRNDSRKIPNQEVEEVVEVPLVQVKQKIVEIPETRVTKKYVEKVSIVYEDKVQIVERNVVKQKIIEVTLIEHIYRDVPLEQVRFRQIPVERRIPQYYDRPIVKVLDIPVSKLWERFIYKPVETPQFTPRLVDKIVERKVYRDVPIDQFRVVPKVVPTIKKIPRPYPVVVEKIVEVESEVEVPSERVVLVPKKVVRRVERPVEVPIEVPREPEVQTEEGLIPLSRWEILKNARLEKGDCTGSLARKP
ncbi:mantle protein-like [Condylostylus longicornis]|uniref:mantle protein-like n=1 Tax=Condylostylus longicornis TaxID=2530218 RepID=UPI00244DE8F3|nr:mantle protein-like [Condylostylus longicornis]